MLVASLFIGGCGDAFPIEGVLVATYLLSVEALPHCRCGVANKSYMAVSYTHLTLPTTPYV